MRKEFYFLSIILLAFSCTSCSSEDANKLAVKDSVPAVVVPVIRTAGTPQYTSSIDSADSTILHFQEDFDQSLLSFAEEVQGAQLFTFSFYDIDKDSSNELLTSYYTGGAHCCDENSIFIRTSKNAYKQIFTYPERLSIKGNVITLSAQQRLGYFYTCYACLPPTMSADPQIQILYDKEQFYFVQNKSLNDSIVNYLGELQKKPIPQINTDDISAADDGERKGYAWNLFAYYYNNFQDKKATEALFKNYYTGTDKDAIWQSLLEIIEQTDEDLSKYNIKPLQ